MPENFIMQVRRPKGVSGERVAFVSCAAACRNKLLVIAEKFLDSREVKKD